MAASFVPVEVTLPPINQPLIDRSTGLVAEVWYRYFESIRNRTGGDEDAISGSGSAASQANDAAGAADTKAQEAQQGVAAVKSNRIVPGVGLSGGGELSQEQIRIAAKQQDGWVASTGGGDKTTPYSAPSTVVITNPPTQAEVQAIADALRALALRYVALEAALFATEALKA